MQTIHTLLFLLKLLNLSPAMVDQVDLDANVAVIDCELGTYEVAASALPAGAVEGSIL